jgi:hypothetical protein
LRLQGNNDQFTERERGQVMKKVLSLVLVFTLAFPVYCFAQPDTVSIDEEVLDEVKLILEDGRVDDEEIASLLDNIATTESRLTPASCGSDDWVAMAMFTSIWANVCYGMAYDPVKCADWSVYLFLRIIWFVAGCPF